MPIMRGDANPPLSCVQHTTTNTQPNKTTRWSCNICGLINELPRGYECQLDAYGHRRDRGQ
jgi:hypothetical protein